MIAIRKDSEKNQAVQNCYAANIHHKTGKILNSHFPDYFIVCCISIQKARNII